MADSSAMAIVDRVEDGVVVLELIDSRFTFDLPGDVLPDDLHEGAAVELEFQLRPDVEQRRREEISDLQDQLIQKPEDES